MAVDGLVGLQVVAFAAAMALVGEVLLWWFIYRKPEFKALKAGLEKATAKLEEAKDGAAANSKKREARLQKWKEETAKHVASNSLKSGVMTTVLLVSSFKLLSTLFGDAGAVVRLPFEPPPFLRKLTQRGLEADADVRDASVTFLFVMCQSSLRPLITKLLGWGPSRAMSEVSPAMPRQWQSSDSKKDS